MEGCRSARTVLLAVHTHADTFPLFLAAGSDAAAVCAQFTFHPEHTGSGVTVPSVVTGLPIYSAACGCADHHGYQAPLARPLAGEKFPQAVFLKRLEYSP